MVAPHARSRAPHELLGRPPPRGARRGEQGGSGIRPATSAGTGDDHPGARPRWRPAPTASSRRALAGVDALQVPERQRRLRIVTPRLIAAAHRHGVEVHVWTVNDPADMRRLVDLGVDGIVTDRADVALADSATLTAPPSFADRTARSPLCIHCEWRAQERPFG